MADLGANSSLQHTEVSNSNSLLSKSVFGQTAEQNNNLNLGNSNSAFGGNTTGLGTNTNTAFGSSNSVFGSSNSAFGRSNYTFGHTQLFPGSYLQPTGWGFSQIMQHYNTEICFTGFGETKTSCKFGDPLNPYVKKVTLHFEEKETIFGSSVLRQPDTVVEITAEPINVSSWTSTTNDFSFGLVSSDNQSSSFEIKSTTLMKFSLKIKSLPRSTINHTYHPGFFSSPPRNYGNRKVTFTFQQKSGYNRNRHPATVVEFAPYEPSCFSQFTHSNEELSFLVGPTDNNSFEVHSTKPTKFKVSFLNNPFNTQQRFGYGQNSIFGSTNSFGNGSVFNNQSGQTRGFSNSASLFGQSSQATGFGQINNVSGQLNSFGQSAGLFGSTCSAVGSQQPNVESSTQGGQINNVSGQLNSFGHSAGLFGSTCSAFGSQQPNIESSTQGRQTNSFGNFGFQSAKKGKPSAANNQISTFGQLNSGTGRTFGHSGLLFGCGGSNTNKINPAVVQYQPTESDDYIYKNTASPVYTKTKIHCITAMEEYEKKSLEELRLENAENIEKQTTTNEIENNKVNTFGFQPPSINKKPNELTTNTFGNAAAVSGLFLQCPTGPGISGFGFVSTGLGNNNTGNSFETSKNDVAAVLSAPSNKNAENEHGDTNQTLSARIPFSFVGLPAQQSLFGSNTTQTAITLDESIPENSVPKQCPTSLLGTNTKPTLSNVDKTIPGNSAPKQCASSIFGLDTIQTLTTVDKSISLNTAPKQCTSSGIAFSSMCSPPPPLPPKKSAVGFEILGSTNKNIAIPFSTWGNNATAITKESSKEKLVNSKPTFNTGAFTCFGGGAWLGAQQIVDKPISDISSKEKPQDTQDDKLKPRFPNDTDNRKLTSVRRKINLQKENAAEKAISKQIANNSELEEKMKSLNFKGLLPQTLDQSLYKVVAKNSDSQPHALSQSNFGKVYSVKDLILTCAEDEGKNISPTVYSNLNKNSNKKTMNESSSDKTVADSIPHQAENRNITSPGRNFNGTQMEIEKSEQQKNSLTQSDKSSHTSSFCIISDDSSLEETTGIVLTRAGYYTIPPLEELNSNVNEEGSCVVPNLTIGRKGYGNVYFNSEIDVAYLNLDEIVEFRNKEVRIYPDEKLLFGNNLNDGILITLDQVWPHDKIKHKPIKDPHRLDEINYEDKLRRACDKYDVQFVEYRPKTGSWVFKVKHFTKNWINCWDEENEISTN